MWSKAEEGFERALALLWGLCSEIEHQFDRSQAIAAWPGAEILLEQALSNLEETVNGKNRLASYRFKPESELFVC